MTQSSTPMVAGASLEDLATLGKSPLLSGLGVKDMSALVEQLDQVAVTAGTLLAREEEPGDHLSIILQGQARVTRKGMVLSTLGPGDYLGGLSLARVKRGSVTVESVTTMRLARLPRRRYESLAETHPLLALHLAQALIRLLGQEFNAMTDSVGAFLRERSLPRRATVSVRSNGGGSHVVATGSSIRSVLPPAPDAEKTAFSEAPLGALVNGMPTSLDAPLVTDATVKPISLHSAEGRDIYRRSAGLMVLEAMFRVAPELRPLAGPSVTGALLVRVPDGVDRAELARQVDRAARQLGRENQTFREEIWGTDEARTHFREERWLAAASLLRTSRAPTQTLATCGVVYGLADGALVPSTGAIGALAFAPHPEGVLVDLGDALRDADPQVLEAEHRALGRELTSPRFGGTMQNDHRAWLEAMHVDSVGAFNERCIVGRAAALIRASEGFHEKQISRLADAICARAGTARIICVAGPSSSGKTTFIRRLTVQLEVNRVHPVGLSLDDYYVDRELTPKDASGGYDFEALEAIHLPLFQEHLRRLLGGETVKTARYDFLSGKSLPEGGESAHLGPRDVVLVEGIHGLNPRVVDGVAPREQIFNVFVHPATTLPLDSLDCVTPEHVRLLRRIVRDRHGRGYAAQETIVRWPSVVRGDAIHIYPYLERADFVFDTALAYELGVIKVYAERYLLEVPEGHVAFPAALRLRNLIERFVAIYPDQVPPTSLLREFIGGTSAEY